MNKDPDWIPLMDYAMKNDVSLSTLRRHIKANKIPFRVEHGRYLLRANQSSRAFESTPHSEDLQLELQRAHEEICELKMLVAAYEELNG